MTTTAARAAPSATTTDGAGTTHPAASALHRLLSDAARALALELVSRPAALAGRTLSAVFAATALVLLLGAGLPGTSAGSTTWLVATASACVGLAVVCWTLELDRRRLDAVLVLGCVLSATAVVAAPSAVVAVVLSNALLLLVVPVGLLVRPAAVGWHLALLVLSRAASQLLAGLPPGVVAASCVVTLAVALPLCALSWVTRNAVLDQLTGLPNRRGVEPAIAAAIADAELSHQLDHQLGHDLGGHVVALAVVDADGLGAVNTHHGWSTGDDLLRGMVRDLRDQLPASTQLARTGGDTFLVLLPDLGGLDPVDVLDTALAALRHPASAGVAVHEPGEGAADLVRRAGAALSHAKLHARGRCHPAAAGSGPLARDLAEALTDPAAHGLHVELQPVVDVSTGDVVGVEALARWSSARRGRVSPLDFVSAAEDGGLVGLLGAFVVRAACREVAPLRARWGSHVFLAVNTSGRELVAPGYVDQLLDALDAERFPTSSLVLEVTESVLDGGSPAAVAALHALRQRGVRVAVDDFGAGYSCLTRLDEVPADFLKLDATLLATAPGSPRRRTLLAAAVGLARSLELTAIAEGAETPEHAALLAELGCPLVQGFGYARPASSVALLAAGAHRPALTGPSPAPSPAC